MTLDEVMKQYNGEWNDDGFAVIQYSDGFYWRIAKKTEAGVEITEDGKKVVGLANTSTSKVESPKRGKAKTSAQDDLNLDDL